MAIQRFSDCAGTLVTESGAWIPVIDSGEIDFSSGHVTSEFVSATGKRSVFLRGNLPRSWKVSGTCRWRQAQALARLADMGPQKFYWISPLGRQTNILPSTVPVYSSRLGVTEIDGVPVEFYGVNAGSNNNSVAAPIKPGMKVTLSAYMSGGYLRAWWRNAAGELMVDAPIEQAKATQDLGFVEVTATAPPGATYVVVAGLRCTLFGAPAVRIAEGKPRFESGASACSWVTLHDVEVSHSSLASSGSMFDVSFRLEEVS